MNYHEAHRHSLENPEAFWGKQAEAVAWYKPPETILSKNQKGHYRWFGGGLLNTCYLALDYHIEQGHGEQLALIYDSPVAHTQKKYTFHQLREETARFAGVLKKLGVEKSDRVIIYMPMVPEAIVAMLACARIGAIHSVVFGGFAPNELATRIDDATPKLLITATCGIEFSTVIPYKPLVDQALELATHSIPNTLVLERPQASCALQAGRDHDWQTLMKQAEPVEPVPVEATHPLYILYTSGTTGKPKGVIRDNGGHAVALKYSMKALYDAEPGSVYWAGSDIGWVVGHSYIVYAPLLQRCTTILFEGKPVRTPDAGTFWRVIAEHGVNTFFTAPTAFRAIKKEDPDGKLKEKYDLRCLKNLFVAGERLDPPTYEWLEGLLPCPVIDHWWQTETGWPIATNPAGMELFPIKSGSATFPAPGYQIEILNEAGQAVPAGETGNIAVKLPLPPGCLPTLWNADDQFEEAYLNPFPGYYITADGGYMDEDGYLFVMGRTDDVINVAGHRLSTGEMEEIIGGHAAVAECAVTGLDDDLKGQVPVGFVVLKDGVNIGHEQLEEELVALIREKIGAVANFKRAAVVARLPKTRSGKILRKTLRHLALQKTVPVPPTIDDPKILEEIRQVMEAQGLTHP